MAVLITENEFRFWLEAAKDYDALAQTSECWGNMMESQTRRKAMFHAQSNAIGWASK